MTDMPPINDFRDTAVWRDDPEGGQFEAPNGLATDARGRVYTTDFRADQRLRIDVGH